jgi:DNA polymerase III subunit delta
VAFTKSKKEKLPSYDEFLEATKGKNYAAIYVFTGQEEYFVDDCTRRIAADLLTADTKAFNYDVLYGSKVEAKDVLALASSYPMMSERRVVIVKEFEKLVSGEQSKDLFAAYISKPLDSTCLVLISEAPDFRVKPFNELKKRGAVYGFPTLWDNQIPPWINARCRAMGKAIDADACNLLHAYAGNSLLALQNEFEKLFTFIGDRTQVTAEDVAAVVGVSKGFTIFELQNALGKRDLSESLRILQRMLDAGETPVMMIVMLTRYFTALWKIQGLLQNGLAEPSIASELKMSPFILKNYLSAAAKFSTHDFERAFAALLDADLQLKSASPDPYHLMELLMYALVRSTPVVESTAA